MTMPGAPKKPLDPKGGSPSEADRLHTATENQSSVKPEDYPQMKRDLQVDAATGRKADRKD
jgi:hypothetical protein